MPDDKHSARQQWYRMRSARWCADDAIQLLPLEAKGALIELTNRCHLSSRAGALIVCGRPIGPQTLDGTTPDDRAALKNLAEVLRISTGKARKIVEKLQKNGVIAVDDDGVFYSPLLAEEREISRIAAEKGRNGGNPHEKARVERLKLAVNNADNPRERERVQNSELRTQKSERESSHPASWASIPRHVRPSVPKPLHTEFLQKLGDGDDPRDLFEFYSRVTNKWKGKRVDEGSFDFWKREMREWRGTTTKRPTKSSDRTAASIDALRSFAGGRS